MGTIQRDETRHIITWKVPVADANAYKLEWQMLENNQVQGLLPFEYYYIDEEVCFQYSYSTMQSVEEYMCHKKADYAILHFLIYALVEVMQRGEEYLLNSLGYFVLPEWIFFNRAEKEVAICYLMGREESLDDTFTTLVEYLMEQTDHSDKRAVEFIYGLYDLITSEGVHIDSLRNYLDTDQIKNGTEETSDSKIENDVKSRKSISRKSVEYSEKANKQVLKGRFCLKYDAGQEKENLHRRVFEIGNILSCGILKKKFTIGRQSHNDLCLPCMQVSRDHAHIICEEEQLFVIDNASCNGTFVNGQKISAYVKTKCMNNDVVTFADIAFKICENC